MAQSSNIMSNPEQAEAIERWQKAFQGSYDLTDPAQRGRFYEGLTEMGKMLAMTGHTAKMSITVGSEGPTGLFVSL